MDCNTFGRLCRILYARGGLRIGRCIGIEEQVAMFLGVLAHHDKNRVVKFHLWRSGATVSQIVHKVLCAILSLHSVLIAKLTPVSENSTNHRWKWFKGCLGALDGTHINVLVSSEDKPQYRTRKGQIATNTLDVCDQNMQFVYLLPGWEGSAGDSQILRVAVSRNNGFKVPQGCYYLCDNAYANSNGFLTPYSGVRYHLKEFGPGTDTPHDTKEMFNMRHTKARNIIERAFAVLKMRWGILRSASFYPIETQIRLIITCFLLHNFVRREMEVDPAELELDADLEDLSNNEDNIGGDYVDCIEPTAEWTQTREAIATSSRSVAARILVRYPARKPLSDFHPLATSSRSVAARISSSRGIHILRDLSPFRNFCHGEQFTPTEALNTKPRAPLVINWITMGATPKKYPIAQNPLNIPSMRIRPSNPAALGRLVGGTNPTQ